MLRLRHVIPNLRLYLLDGLLHSVRLGGRVGIYCLQVESNLGIDLGQSPVHLPDVFRQTGLQRDDHFLEYAPVQALHRISRGHLFRSSVCESSTFLNLSARGPRSVISSSRDLRGSLREFHRHAEQESVAKGQRKTLEERGLIGLLHKT